MPSATDDVQFDEKDRLSSLFSAKLGDYPTQAKGDLDATCGGEYRGYYKSRSGAGYLDRWFPKQSEHDGRSTKANNHNGIDIYTAYYPYPRETPILAVTSGYFTPLADRERPNKIGNRAAIDTKVGGQAITFRYGHLSRFEGRARRVKKGDVIGFAGCSGNADTAGECSANKDLKVGECNVTSCHVHLVAAFGANAKGRLNDVDPVLLLRWLLRFGGMSKPISCADWLKKEGLEAPLENTGETGALVAEAARDWRRARGRRRPLAAPFQDIEFDSTKAIRTTKAAYKEAVARLGNPEVLEKAIDSFVESNSAVKQILVEIDNEIAQLVPKKLPGGPIARAHILTRLALWHLMGGTALAAAIDNRRRSESSVAKVTEFFECGVSVGGEAQLIAVDGGRNALHRSFVDVPDPNSQPPKTTRIRVISLSFDAGSLMHATWPEGIGSGGDLGICIELAVWVMWQAFTEVQRRAARLSDVTAEDHDIQLNSVKSRLGDIKTWLSLANEILDVNSLPSPDERMARRAELGNLLKDVAALNSTVFDVADAESIKKEEKAAIGPRFSTLRVQQPEVG